MFNEGRTKAKHSVLGSQLTQLLRVGAGFAIGLLAANGSPILDASSSISASDPIQWGQLSRSGIPSDWSTHKAFPRVVNPTLGYHYETFSVPVGTERYFEIAFNALSLTANDFVSAYANSYDPGAGLAVNYLGDAGFSGNYFAVSSAPIFFQVFAPPSVTHLVIVVSNATAAGRGIEAPFEVVANSYLDTDNNSVPESSTSALFLGGGLVLCLVGLARKRKRFPDSARLRSLAGWLLLISLASLTLVAQNTASLSPGAAQQIVDVMRHKPQILKTNSRTGLNLYFASKKDELADNGGR